MPLTRLRSDVVFGRFPALTMPFICAFAVKSAIQSLGQVLVRARRRDREVGAADERRHRLARACGSASRRRPCTASASGCRPSGRARSRTASPGRRTTPRGPARTASVGNGFASSVDLLALESARNVFLNAFRPGDRPRLVERAGPLAARRRRDLPAVVVDEGERGVPVLAGDVERREGLVARCSRSSSFLPSAMNCAEARRRARDAGLLEQVGVVDDDAGARVVRDAHQLAVVGRRVAPGP